jgi:hypothetical protein
VHTRKSIDALRGRITDRIIGCDRHVPTSNHVTFIYDKPLSKKFEDHTLIQLKN